MKLSDAEMHEKHTIVELLSQTELQERLQALGVVEGCEICPLRTNNATMIVDVRGCRYALSKDITDCILVRRL